MWLKWYIINILFKTGFKKRQKVEVQNSYLEKQLSI